jgi:NADH-ubiquinone oxidoreductase chain 5
LIPRFTTLTLICFTGSLRSFIYFNNNNGIILEIIIFKIESTDYTLSLSLDSISMGYLSCILLVSSCILIFTIFYIQNTLNYRRFIYIVMIFILSMSLMVLSDNFIALIVGWDGLGLISFCLVIFYENSQSLRSGILTVLTNRLGDSLFLCSIYYFLSIGGYTTNYINTINTIFVFIIVAGRITKRAQIPFCS